MADKTKPSAMAKVQGVADKAAGWVLLAPGEAAQASSRMSRRSLAWWGIAFGAVILLSVNVMSSSLFRNATADLTDQGLYTISDSTRRVLSKIEEPIDVRVYFSERLGEISALHKRYFARVRGLFERYAGMTGGLLKVSFIDPVPFSDAEDRAVAAGLSGVRIGNGGENGYFGLVATNSTDDQEVVQFFAPQRESFLEYDMTKLVHKLASPKKPVIGMIAGVPISGGMSPRGQQMRPWIVMSQIEEFFEVETLAMSVKEIPAKVDVLVLVFPVAITTEAAYAIDQFVLRGGRVLAFLDPVSEIGRLSNPMLGMGGKGNPDLDKLLKAWGVTFDSKHIAGDAGNARRVQAGGAQGVVTDYVAWLGLGEHALDGKEVIADGVKLLNLATPGHIAAVDGATTKLQPILKTSANAMLIDTAKVTGYQPDPVGLLREYKPGGKELILAARVTGEIQTAFPDGPPKSDEKDAADAAKQDDKAKDADKKEAEANKEDGPKQLKSGKVNAIIIADSDMLYDEFWVQARDMLGQQLLLPNAHNSVFVLNALENLTGGEALTGLRGRGVDDRPFELVNEIRREAEQKYRRSEQTLMAKLEGLQKQLSEVSQQAGPDGSVRLSLSEQDNEAIETARAEMIKTRQELRGVKHALRADIEQLEGWVKFINIALVPLLIGGAGFALGALRRRRSQS